MAEEHKGTLVRFEKNGVGVIDVEGLDQYVYFTPKDIAGYVGQTVPELKRQGRWTDGKTVIIRGDIQSTGSVQVESVKLKDSA